MSRLLVTLSPLAIAAALLACAPTPLPPVASLDPEASAEAYRLPAVQVLDYFVLPVSVDGDPDRTLWMIVDSGFRITTIDPDSYAAVTGGEGGELGELSVGRLHFEDLNYQLSELDHISARLGGFPVDGFLGYPAFAGLLLTFDYPAGELRVAPGELPRADGEHVFQLVKGERLSPYLELRLGGQTVKMCLDTGSSGFFSVTPELHAAIVDGPVHSSVSTIWQGASVDATGRLDGEVELFGRRYLAPLVDTYPDDNLIGTQVLRHFALTFDAINRRVQVEGAGADWPKGEAPVIGAKPRWGTGLLSIDTPEGEQVVGVAEGSPAEAAGLAKGDLIVERSGVPWPERGAHPLPHWREGERRFYELVVEREGERRVVELELVELLPVPEGVPKAPPRHRPPEGLAAALGSSAGPSQAALAEPGAELSSPDGRLVAQIIEREGRSIIRVFDAHGHILANPVTRGLNRGLEWSEDGRWLTYWRGEPSGDEAELSWSRWVVPATGRQEPEALDPT